MKQKQGFTLIELLVVVAIIGILATVVLASLGQARQRARDAAIKAAVSQARADVELFFLDNNTYVGADANLTSFDTSINDNGGTAAFAGSVDGYRYSSPLNAGSDSFCVDQTGFAGEVTTVPTAAAGSGANCGQ